MPDTGLETVTVAVAFADLAGFTAMTDVHGDDDAASVAERFYELAQKSLLGDTRIVKTIGDAVMVSGPDVRHAALTVLSLSAQVELEPRFPSMRAGVHCGPVVLRHGDMFGATVNVAARVAAYARSGQVLCTAAVCDALAGETRISVRPLGAVSLRNVQRAMELFEVASCAPMTEFVFDPVCRMHVELRACVDSVEHEGRAIHFCSESCRATFIDAPDRYI